MQSSLFKNKIQFHLVKRQRPKCQGYLPDFSSEHTLRRTWHLYQKPYPEYIFFYLKTKKALCVSVTLQTDEGCMGFPSKCHHLNFKPSVSHRCHVLCHADICQGVQLETSRMGAGPWYIIPRHLWCSGPSCRRCGKALNAFKIKVKRCF